jgi:hypothetical protein
MTPRMSTSESIDIHGIDTPRARAYFAEYLEDGTLEFLDDTFEYDTDDLGETADALLAAELLAAWIGMPAPTLPDNIKAACKGRKGPDKKLLTKARTAVRAAIADDAPVRAHFKALGKEDAWVASVRTLLDRLT